MRPDLNETIASLDDWQTIICCRGLVLLMDQKMARDPRSHTRIRTPLCLVSSPIQGSQRARLEKRGAVKTTVVIMNDRHAGHDPASRIVSHQKINGIPTASGMTTPVIDAV